MRKRKLFLLLAAAVFLLCGCGKPKEPENPYRLKTQILEQYWESEIKTIRTEYIYDENGYLSELQTFDGDDWWYTRQFFLDEHGNNHGSEANFADGTQAGERALTLDDQGRMITSESYQNSQVNATTEYGYSGDGQITKLYINRIGALHEEDWKSFVDRTFDRKGRLTREDTRWEPDNNASSYTLYHYEKDNLLRTETYKGEELDNYTDYIYSEEGLVQVAITRQADGTLQSKHVTIFDEYGNELEVVAYAYASELARFGQTDEEPDSRTTYVYELKE